MDLPPPGHDCQTAEEHLTECAAIIGAFLGESEKWVINQRKFLISNPFCPQEPMYVN
jgi:hypothetical protein